MFKLVSLTWYFCATCISRILRSLLINASVSQASPGPPQVQRILRHLVQCLCLLCLASHNANTKFQHQKAKSWSVMFALTAITQYQVQLGSRLAIQQGTVCGGFVSWDCGEENLEILVLFSCILLAIKCIQ